MSDSRRTSPQYRIIQQLTPELTDAVKDNLCDLSNHLLKHGLITENNHEDFTKHSVSSYVRASNLIRTILNRIKVDVRHYSTFVKVLKENEQYYKSVLQKIYSHNDEVVTFGQPSLSLPELPPSDMEQSDNEASPLLRAPYVQYESDSDCSKRQDTIDLPKLIHSVDSADEDFDKPHGGVQHQQLDDAQRAREQHLDAIIVNFCLPCIISIEVVLIVIHFITSACINILWYMFTLIVITALVACILIWNAVFVRQLILYGSRLCTRRNVLCNTVPWIVVVSIWCFIYLYLCT